MGVGMSIVVPAEDVEKALEVLKASGEDAYVMWNNDILATIVLNGGNKA